MGAEINNPFMLGNRHECLVMDYYEQAAFPDWDVWYHPALNGEAVGVLCQHRVTGDLYSFTWPSRIEEPAGDIDTALKVMLTKKDRFFRALLEVAAENLEDGHE